MDSRIRRLNVGDLLQGVPTWGTCDKCGAFFSVGPGYFSTPELAREKLLSDFDKHECKAGSGQKTNARSAPAGSSDITGDKKS